ncbi:branched-chain amino acid ABC transporter ATP-binding protein/permease [Nocardioides terrisoli]|uniref:branched-chain amino acid ABC transporter ATP-binding protein/permease n=1 Tax=Nocardioides terrisoli TaxID=3388267 RepID=UPI00287B710C|nr:branched-chain amino acid ABC transporter ATP-binding protein/permease [Nocardioides marmorisolisilvae]
MSIRPGIKDRLQGVGDRLHNMPVSLRVLIVVALAMLVVPTTNAYTLAVATSIVTYAILGLGLNVVVGYAGLLDLGYAAFFAIGSYTAALLMTKLEWNFFATLPAAVVAAGIAGAVLGYPTLRLRSDYLAIVTLGFGEMTYVAFNNWSFSGGPEGIFPIPPPSAFGWKIDTDTGFYVFGVILLGVAIFFNYNLGNSWLGRGWIAIREDEVAAEATGTPTLRLKLVAYVFGGAWAGLAGAFFAARIGIVGPTSFTFTLSGLLVIMVVLGGLGSTPGVILGAVLIVALPEYFRQFSEYRLLIFAVALIIVMLLRPQGLWPRGRDQRVKALPPDRDWQYADVRPGSPAMSLIGERSHGDQTLLALEGVEKRFGGLVCVDKVSLDIHRGEIFSIIGPNGAGKTTLFNCVTGVIRPTRGSIRFNGRSIQGLSPHRISHLGLARTFQHVRLFRDMGAHENVMAGMYASVRTSIAKVMLFPGRVRKVEVVKSREARGWMTFVGLGDVTTALPYELPYGDQRRLEVARALASHPQMILLDEPAAGMNSSEKLEFSKVIRAIRDLGITVVIIDHDMPLVMSVSDRVAVLDQGRLIALGAPKDVAADPRVLGAYLGEDEDELPQDADLDLGAMELVGEGLADDAAHG